MSINSNFGSAYMNAKTANAGGTAAKTAGGGFINEVLGGSLPMVAISYGKTVYRSIRHPKNCINAIKQTNDIIKKLNLKGLSQVQAAEVYGETFRSIHKGLNAKEAVDGIKVAKDMANTVKANAVAIKQAATTSGKVFNWTKGALKTGGFKGMAIFATLFELPELFSAFKKGGVGEGIKQVGKSAVKVAADSAGWAVGSVGGGAVGAKLGFMLGTAVPGIGNMLGASIGAALGTIIGGIGGSWICGKTAKSVIGKSFTEKQAEKEQIANNNAGTIGYGNPMISNMPLRGYQPQFNPYLSKGYNGIY